MHQMVEVILFLGYKLQKRVDKICNTYVEYAVCILLSVVCCDIEMKNDT